MSTAPAPSCATCPAFLSEQESPSKFKRSIGSPICGRFGIPLSRPDDDPANAEARAKHFAKGCGAHGQPMPPVPVEKRLEVALPDPVHRTELPDSASEKAACKSCAQCVHYVRPDAVARSLGWTMGLCSAKGKLVLTSELTREANGCPWRQWGPVRTDTAGVQLLPEYGDDFAAASVFEAFRINREKQAVEPSEYETDKPVSESERADGIRAWRKVQDPESENFTYLPIYDPEHFPEADRALIPKSGDDEHPELYVDHFGGVYLAAVCWSELDETPALHGEAGTGKTELFRHLAWLMQVPFRRISITGSTELDDLAGKMRFSPDEGTYFQYGRLPLAWMSPGVICIDEPNTGPPEVWQFLRPLTDNSKQLILDANKGEPIKRHPDAYLGMAMNPSWDVRNVGTIEIADADVNRLFHIYVELPPEALEREIIQARVKLDGWELDSRRMNMLMGIAKDIRALCADGTLPISWAIRPQIKVARALRWFDTKVAYKRAVADYLEPQAQEALLNIVRSHTE